MEPPGQPEAEKLPADAPNEEREQAAERDAAREKADKGTTEIAKQIAQTEKDIEKVKAGEEPAPAAPAKPVEAPPAPKPTDDKKTKKVKLQAIAADAMAKTDLAMAKLSKAKKLRQVARDKLKAEGKPVPENLKAGALKAVEDKAAAAKVAASMAVQNAKGAPESKLGEGQLEERSSVDEAVAAADAAIQDALEAMRA
jgi:hypothetical protein